MARALRGIGFTGCGKTPHAFCHSERSEESLFLFMGLNRREIPRFARNDKINYFFRSLFSLWVFYSEHRVPHASPSLIARILLQLKVDGAYPMGYALKTVKVLAANLEQ